ncbi:alpha/beta fold hydrolase [Pelagibius sp.]|uniref:alpha/beta fold hydrolase n=1 Tax=Pelagibius sp. TaxID=1931238 RepID=UPI002620BA18|nr:alpha/beta hydrolase [Pelagibius sp.]
MTILRKALPFARLDSDHPVPVVALHCSGSDARQWRHLAASLDLPFHLIAPSFLGADGRLDWHGAHPFALADEAAPILERIDALNAPFHLIGHSYGGGVALHIALQRPHAVTSMTLYEPSAFHLLKAAGAAEEASFSEIRAVAEVTAQGVASGDYRGAATHFVDYWSGEGAWAALRPSLQEVLTSWLPKAPLDFHALIEEPTALSSYRRLEFPVLLLRGSLAPPPTAAVIRLLHSVLPRSSIETVAGAGHMGPITHAEDVSRHILRFLQVNQKPTAPPPAGDAASGRPER